MMIYIAERWRVAVVLLLSLLLAELVSVGISFAQLKPDEVNFEVLDTVTLKKGDVLWNLAKKYYKDPYQWEFIMKMNKIPNERRLSVGTVIYIPVKDAKPILREAEVVKEDLSGELAKLRAEIERLKEENAKLREENAKLKEENTKLKEENIKLTKKLEECEAKRKQLAKQLKNKDANLKKKNATIKDLQEMLDNVKAAFDKMKADRSNYEDEIAAKDRRIRELKAELEECQAKLRRLEREINELRIQISQVRVVQKEPEEPVKKAVNNRSMVAAIAIALVGSIIWIASD
jgi:septal ring factor EnvC (AmiA/AmiB activator)